MTASDSGDGGSPPQRGGPIAGTIGGDLQPCWLCGRSVAPRALFCHGCGAVQPPRPGLDHFARLGLERRFDIDLEHLARQRAGLGRALEPERFATRGVRQQTLARQQLDALAASYDVLRDPVRRARCLLEMEGEPAAPGVPPDPEAQALAATLSAADDAAAVDRLGAEVTRRIEGCVKDLSAAFRAGRTADAAVALARLEALEAIAAAARDRRATLTP